MTVVVQPTEIAEFAPVGPFCVGEVPPPLDTVDKNGITGTWSPAVISTASADTTEYIFTPDPALHPCGVKDTLTVVVNPTVAPVLPEIGPICQYLQPPELPDTALNGVTGTWLPDIINTDHPGTFKFVFTPDSSYACSVKDSIFIEIDTLIIPQFLPLDPVCQFDTPPELPEANFNGVTGTWMPSETQTDSAGIFPYVFEPDPTYNCAATDTLWLEVKPWITPEFDPIGPLCVNNIPPELPEVSNNGISGFWTPDTISTATTGTFEYIFTPDDSVMCAYGDTLTISIEQNFKPVAGNDSTYTVQEYPVDIAILENDSDSPGILDTASFALVDPPARGTVLFDDSTGIVTYMPEVGYFGQDTFYYAIFDFGGACEPLGDTARVVIEIDEPNNPPVALNDSFTVACKPLTENLLANDSDPDGDIIEAIVFPTVEPQHGTLAINSNGSFNYMPDEGFVGIDSFRYEICDNGLPQLCDDALVWIMVLPDADCDEVPEEPGEEDDECTLLIPEGFSPNGDGVHDFFDIFCIEKYPDAIMRIFDRAGNKLYEKQHYGNLKYWGSEEEALWGGKSENKWTLGRDNLPAGNYLYVLELGNGEVRTGTVMIAY
jgi:gliding motility-associated-like protein